VDRSFAVGRSFLIPALFALSAHAFEAVAGELKVLVRDTDGKPLPGAVVFLESPSAARVVRPLAEATIAQKGRQFIPDLLVIPRGTAVEFPNQDTVRHHVYSFSPTKKFELKLYTGTPANPVIFDRPGVVTLGCNIHDNMIAWIVVVNTPYFGTTGKDGVIAINDAPDGQYELRVWSREMTAEGQTIRQMVKVAGTQSIEVSLKVKGN
jgi:plastocyanin